MTKRRKKVPQKPEVKAAYDKAYNARESEKKKRAMRNAARRKLMEEGVVHKGDGKDVDHVKMLKDGGSNSRKNLRVVSKETNRGWRGRKK